VTGPGPLLLWTDGSTAPTNPGPGGWAVTSETHMLAMGHEKNTTNIRMEGCAIIRALQLYSDQPVVIHTDSQLWVNTIIKWAPSWERMDWHKKDGTRPANLDLVQAGLSLYRRARETTQLVWIRGHNGNAGNELADHWANQARLAGLGLTS
jgi:ribonuclease HI